MTLYSEGDWAAAQAVAELCYTNPFTARRIELERQALGPGFVEARGLWSRSSLRFRNPNVPGLRARTRELLAAGHAALEAGQAPTEEEHRVHAAVVRYHLFDRFDEELNALVQGVVGGEPSAAAAGTQNVSFYGDFRDEAERCFGVGGGLFGEQLAQVPHLFATSVQVRLAFTFIFQSLLGTSEAAGRLRAATWRSIFTYDMRRYERVLYGRMHEVPTLVLGPSGTGKELVARAVGLCGYVPFNGERKRFAAPLAGDFRAVNLTAMSQPLIESELFGHKKGAFTGAITNRPGLFEQCGPSGAVFLDEIGELEGGVQVKLLRVLQSRRFERVGDAKQREFRGRVIAATHRDVAAQLRTGDFRTDLYYRLCAHTIRTPGLAEQLAQAPGDLDAFVEHIVERVLGAAPDDVARVEASALCEQIVAFIDARLGRDYAWPGNVRELEQCVRSFVVQRDYAPTGDEAAEPPEPIDVDAVLGQLQLTERALLDRYCAALFRHHGTVAGVARALGLHRATAKARLVAAGVLAQEG